MTIGGILALVGTILIALDLILSHTTSSYARHLLLQIGCLLLGIAVLVGGTSILRG